jgi:hypothetical protein
MTRGAQHRITACAALLLAWLLASMPAWAQQAPKPSPAHCRVGAYIVSIHDVNTRTQTFDADAWLWSICPDRARNPLKTIEFTNADETAATLDSNVSRPAGAWSQQLVRGTFRGSFNLANFPFDRHRLTISLEEGVEDASAFRYAFDARNTKISPHVRIPQWTVTGLSGNARIVRHPTTFGDPDLPDSASSNYSRIDVHIDIARSDITGFFKLAVPVYVAALLALVSLLMHVEEGGNLLNPRLALLAGLLFAVIFNLRSVDDLVGQTSALSLMDHIHFSTLALLAVVTSLSILQGLLVERGVPVRRIRRLDYQVFAWSGGLYILLNLALVGSAMWKG